MKRRITQAQLAAMEAEVLKHPNRLYSTMTAAKLSRRNNDTIRAMCKSGVISAIKDDTVYPPQWVITADQMLAILKRPRRPDRVAFPTLEQFREQYGERVAEHNARDRAATIEEAV